MAIPILAPWRSAETKLVSNYREREREIEREIYTHIYIYIIIYIYIYTYTYIYIYLYIEYRVTGVYGDNNYSYNDSQMGKPTSTVHCGPFPPVSAQACCPMMWGMLQPEHLGGKGPFGLWQ